MTGIDRMENCFLPLNQRAPSSPSFLRVIGRDGQGRTTALLQKFYQLTQNGGLYLPSGIANPTEPETARFFEAVGAQFFPERALVERHMTVWLGQLRPAQRQVLAQAVMDALSVLKAQGANDNIIKNAYIKFMCWFRSLLGHVLMGIGKASPPKVLFEGNITKYEVLLLHLLHRAGCDVWYVNFASEESYKKADPTLAFSQLVQGDVFSPPSPHFAASPAGSPAPAQRPASASARPAPPPRPSPLPPPPWTGLDDAVFFNAWVGDKPVWDAVLLPCDQRALGPKPKLCALFAAVFGADERSEYRNRLFRLKRALDASGKVWRLLEQKPPAPTAAETAPFLSVDKSAPRGALIRALADRLTPNCGKVQALLLQRAFALAMERSPEQDSVRLFNRGVRLACWLRRYAEVLFEGYRAERQPALVFYGTAAESEITFLWAMAQAGVDVLCFCPERDARKAFAGHYLPPLWLECCFEGSLPSEPFPQREERVRAGTTAYNASRELDQLLYSDTGMFRDRQFARSQPVTLKTTYDEVEQLWKEEAQYRPSFKTEGGVVYVPNLFSKVCGVDKGALALYWDRIRAMVTEETYLVTSLPFLKLSGPSMSAPQARAFLHSGRLDPKALKASQFYRYGYLPDDTQDYMLEKIQALMDYDLITGGGDLTATMLSVLTNLDKELLRLLQNFDFTRTIPKFLVVDVTETLFSLEECILLAFLNLVGFDIAVFTPTGYRNLESHLRPDSFDTLTAGEFLFDLTVPDLRSRRAGESGGWLGRLFGAGRP